MRLLKRIIRISVFLILTTLRFVKILDKKPRKLLKNQQPIFKNFIMKIRENENFNSSLSIKLDRKEIYSKKIRKNFRFYLQSGFHNCYNHSKINIYFINNVN